MADDKPAESGPKPGHFLPGGSGEPTPEDASTAAPRPAGRPLTLGKAQPVRPPVDPSMKKAKPRPLDAGTETSGFGAPPPAPLPDAPPPGVPLTAPRQAGGARPVGWHKTSTRGASQYSAEPPPVKQQRRYSKPVIAGLCLLIVLVLGGGGIASARLIDSFDTVENPLARPSVRPSDAPMAPLPDPTVTVTVQPVPDAVRVKQNKLYAVGKVPSVNCKEPAVRPTTQAAILRYYQALLPCFNKAWAPLVTKAGYEFRPPKLTLLTKQVSSECTGERSHYCGDDETIVMDWQDDLKNYPKNKLETRISMMAVLAHEYGHHVQMLTHILISSHSRIGWAKTTEAKLEEERRMELQASCLAAVFLGANKASLQLTGTRLDIWEFDAKNTGDEYNPKKIRDHGSRKNHWLWSGPAFNSASPASCNTFTAPAAKVS